MPLNEMPALAVFGFNRPDKLHKCLRSLGQSQFASDLKTYVFIDGARTHQEQDLVDQCQNVARNAEGFQQISVVMRSFNMGLSKSVTSGIAYVLARHKSAIFVEDDLVVSPGFLPYMLEGLHKFENDGRVASVHGYIYPCKDPVPEYFFLRGADCWGWGTWADRWSMFNPSASELLSALERHPDKNLFDFDGAYPYTELLRKQSLGRVDSWAIRWYASAFLNDKLTLYPGRSFVRNTGADGSGTHMAPSAQFEVSLNDVFTGIPEIEIADSTIGRSAFRNYFIGSRPSIYRRLLGKFTRVVRGR